MLSKLTYLIAAAFIIVVYGSCCKGVSCPTVFQFNLHNFSKNDVDTLWVISKKNAAAGLDTMRAFVYTGSDSTQYHVDIQVDSIYAAYTLYIPSVNRQYTISDITLQREVCNKCFLNPTTYAYQVKTAHVNDTAYGKSMDIYK